MKRLLIPLAAAAALAVPTGALAWGGHHHHHHGLLGEHFGFFAERSAVFAKLSGTGTSFAASSATTSGSILAGNPLASGTYSASLSTDWAHAMSHTFDAGTASCAPATGKLSLASGSQTADLALSGKTCSFTPTGASSPAKFVFFGAGTASGALTGTDRVFLKEDSTGAVRGAVFGGFHHEDNDNDGD
jgi:hypothetical protein